MTMELSEEYIRFMTEATEKFRSLGVEYELDIERALKVDGRASALAMMFGMMAAVVGVHKNWFGNERGDELCEAMLEIFTSQKMEERS